MCLLSYAFLYYYNSSSKRIFIAYAYTASAYPTSDYQFIRKTNLSPENYWLTQPLWLKEKAWFGKKQTEFKNFRKHCEQLSQNLINLGLDFLAEDLQKLWFGTLTNEQRVKEPHWQNYAKNLSDSDFINADTLREAILGETETINAVRILLLGSGGAGKTTLAKRLRNQTPDEYCPSTLGIDYFNHEPLKLKGKDSAFQHIKIEDSLKLYLWDFAGQTLFYGMHRSFLHENCVYVLVIDSRHEQAPDPWLHHIYHLAGKDHRPPILVVVNEYENCHNPQNQDRLQRLFGKDNLQFFHFNCQKPQEKDFNQFKQALLAVAKHSRHSTSARLLDASDYLKTLFKQQVFGILVN
jgi:GTPase SAR1 family protein